MKDTQQDILTFWFEETKPEQWFQKSDDFDELIKTRFEEDFDLAVEGIYDGWMQTPEGCLALCILLDQFPRNMYRNTPLAFANDAKALGVAKHAIAHQYDDVLPSIQARFIYLPFEHSEDLQDQKTSVALFEKIKNEDELGYEYAVKHYNVIKEFGRFPHRNEILARKSTQEELIYLAKPGSGF